MQKILFFFKAETVQAVGIREPAKGAELLGLQRVLQFVGYCHVSHARDYSKTDWMRLASAHWNPNGEEVALGQIRELAEANSLVNDDLWRGAHRPSIHILPGPA
jgi:hypothetical protein